MKTQTNKINQSQSTGETKILTLLTHQTFGIKLTYQT
jgi:hypothetical protein